MTSRKDKKSGFTLLEMVIALGISSIALGGFLSMSNMLMERTQARLIGSQALAVASAARGFVIQNKTSVLAGLPAINDAADMLVEDMQTMGYLPADFVNQNAYGQSYKILVKREDAGAPGPDSADMLVILVVTAGGQAITDKMGLSLVSSMGAAGGFIFSDAPSIARGAAGGWEVDLSGAGWSSIAGYTPAAGTLALLANILPTGVGGAVVSGGGGGSGGGSGGGLLAEDAPCNEENKGGLRWNATAGSLQLCDGTNWKTILAALDPDDGDPSIPVPGSGYFVLTKTTWNGAFGGMSGANDNCLTDLTTYNWLGKSDAASRGLLTSEHVRVWFGSHYLAPGNEGNPNTTYSFAVSNDLTAGGATFTTDEDGRGPGNLQNWSGTNYFNGSKTYWSGRDRYVDDYGDEDMIWRFASYDDYSNCRLWVSSSSTYSGATGLSAATDFQRFHKVSAPCNQTRRLICWVNP